MASAGARDLLEPVSFSFFTTSDIGLQIQLRVDRLQGCLPVYREAESGGGSAPVRPSALCLEGRICSYGQALGIPARTPWAEAGTAGASWDAWLAFPLKYRDLGHDAQLALTVWEVRDAAPRRPLAGATLRLFSKKGRLKTGVQELQLWPGRAADGGWPSTTPAKVPVAQRGELGRVEQVLKRYNRGEVEQVDWLDSLALAGVAQLRAREQAKRQEAAELASDGGGSGGSSGSTGSASWAGGSGGGNGAGTAGTAAPGVAPGGLQLLVELPSFPRTVIYQQATAATAAGHAAAGPGGLPASATHAGTATADAISTPLPGTSGVGGGGGAGGGTGGPLMLLHDAEVGRENPAEAKAAKLARSVTRGMVDKKLKPDTEERRRIEGVLDYPPNRPLSPEDKALLWRFRYALTADARALTKFLKCVDWSDASEARQAAELTAQWAPIGVADALELLSPDFVNEEVRGHAVEVLQKTDDEELLCYLLQLVQALRYEAADDSRLASFLVSRARRSITVASFLFWYLLTELGEDSFGPRASVVQSAIIGATGGQQASPTEECIHQQVMLMARLKHISETVSSMRGAASKKADALRGLLSPGGVHADLAGFSCPCPLDPSVQLLGLVPSECSVFKSAMTPLRLTFKARLPGGSSMMAPPGSGSSGSSGEGGSGGSGGSGLQQPHELLTGRMASLTLASQHSFAAAAESGGGGGSVGGSRSSSRRQSLQHAGGGGGGGSPGLTSPPHHQQQQQQQQQQQGGEEDASLPGGRQGAQQGPGGGPGAQQDSLGALEQALPTALVTLIYKRGDDLRQDQLVVQMISLMDRLLKREHLDLRITPYQVLATSGTDGLIEFVPSQPLARVLADNRSIHRFLAMHHPDPAGPFGLSGEVLSTFVRSCAGYCVMTWLLGVGDRHLDNLMLSTDGRLFHIDFGYILGRDPKPFPPPMKLCKEMVDAMGGQESEHYRQFKTYCCEAYNILRKSANLLLSLFHLMAGASIPDIASDPEKAMLKLQEKLRPDLKDEEAAMFMTQVLSDSATALMPAVMEKAHQWAQYWR